MHGTLKRAQNPSRVVTKPNLKKNNNFSRMEIIYFFIHFHARDAQFKSIFETPIVVTGKKSKSRYQNHAPSHCAFPREHSEYNVYPEL